MATQPIEKTYPLTGGMISDDPLTLKNVVDVENMLSTVGGGAGLKPREGIAPILRLTPSTDSGMAMWLVRDSRNPSRRILVVQNARTKKIVKIATYTEQLGRLLPEIATGGTDPIGANDNDSSNIDDDNPTSSCEIAFDAAEYDANLGETVTVRINRSGDTDSDVFVAYSTVYDPGSSNTDFDEATGIVMIEAGEDFVEFDVDSHDTGQTTAKGGTIGICQVITSDPLAEATIGTPDETQLVFEVNGVVIAWNPPSNLATAVPIMAYFQGSGDCIAYYLEGFHGSTGTAPVSSSLHRVGRNHLCYITNVSNQIWANVYRISDIFSGGGAYSAGATTKVAAIKASPIYSVNAGTGHSVQTSQFACCAYDDTRFVVMTGTTISIITTADGTKTTNSITGLTGGYSSAYVSTSNSNNCTVDSAGYIVATIIQQTPGTRTTLARINPITGAVSSMSTTTGTATFGYMRAPIATGGIVTNASLTYYLFAADLQSSSTLGSADLAAPGTDDWNPVRSDDSVLVRNLTTLTNALDRWLQNIVSGSWSQDWTTAPETNGDLRCSANNFFSDTVMYGLAGQNGSFFKLKKFDATDGTLDATIDIVDTYGGEAHDTDIADITDGTFGETSNSFRAIADIFWYNPQFINGAL